MPEFEYTGHAQSAVVPDGVHEIYFQITGARGANSGGSNGGKGSAVDGWARVTPGEVLQVGVGRMGSNSPGPGQAGSGGWSVIGTGGRSGYSHTAGGGGGGGASSVSIASCQTCAFAPLAVAGGGGGAGGAGASGTVGGGGGSGPSSPGGDGSGSTPGRGGAAGAEPRSEGGGGGGAGSSRTTGGMRDVVISSASFSDGEGRIVLTWQH